MADLQFSGGGSDRRRRMLTSDLNSSADSELEVILPKTVTNSGADAFPLLSRDRLIRRLISPRLWKHVVLICFLTLLPASVGVAWMISDGVMITPDNGTEVGGIVSILRGLSGLELFLAAQLCLLICWVRSASAVDFFGGFRTWRWMSVILFCASLVHMTGAASSLTNLMAAVLTPVFGTIRSARPALLFVPAGAVTVFVLRYLIPDMGRCRTAQLLAIAAATLTIVRIVAGLRWSMTIPVERLALLDLLISGLVLSASELHCRYVIHVNPHPPVAVVHSSCMTTCQVDSVLAGPVNSGPMIAGSVIAGSDMDVVPSEPEVASEDASTVDERAERQAYREAAVESDAASVEKPASGRSKSAKKKLRKAG